ncbi:hypothetical protein QJS66_12510 [Kocuria rhizophila]|nr:hypothetical protein QJS66_12510 [Kocuria rhizophila]
MSCAYAGGPSRGGGDRGAGPGLQTAARAGRQHRRRRGRPGDAAQGPALPLLKGTPGGRADAGTVDAWDGDRRPADGSPVP